MGCKNTSVMFGFLLILSAPVLAQTGAAADPATAGTGTEITVWNHSLMGPYWISGQANIILQAHPAFHAPYSGPNSLRPRGEYKTSLLGTLYTGIEVGKHTELLLDVESTGGRGISQALGLAGFTNLDVVRNPNLGSIPYVARAILFETVPLSSEMVEAERGPFSLATQVPVRRLNVRIGKFSLADYFDQNSVGSDSHLQFMNWTVDNNGAYDYAADTRGYTYGTVVEYQDRNWGVRFAETLMPRIANGIRIVFNLREARAENTEFEYRGSMLARRHGAIRLLSYVNHANMGVYRTANENFLLGKTSVPDIAEHPKQTTIKYGFGVNAEQELTSEMRVFARWGWNEGQHESFAYTEVDETFSGGADYKGEQWGRKNDKIGLAFVSNGISKDHQAYLALGGQGFLLGDGRLTYGRESILESYYNTHLWRGFFSGPDLQYVVNPGYNRDRGPVVVPGWRLHVDF